MELHGASSAISRTQSWILNCQAAVKTALRMNDSHFAMSIYEEAGDVYFKGHRNQMASLPFYRVMQLMVKLMCTQQTWKCQF